jgi:hypothetical protein
MTMFSGQLQRLPWRRTAAWILHRRSEAAPTVAARSEEVVEHWVTPAVYPAVSVRVAITRAPTPRSSSTARRLSS